MKQLIALLIVVCIASCHSREPEKTGLEGKTLPEFTLMLSDSTTFFKTSSLPTGKPVAVFYFSPVCPFCRAQTEEIIDEMDNVKDINFLFVTSYPLQSLKSFNKEYNLAKYANITTGVDTALFVRNYYETVGVPYMAIYGKDRKLKKSFLGNINSTQIKNVSEE